jgi:hypothetical protein
VKLLATSLAVSVRLTSLPAEDRTLITRAIVGPRVPVTCTQATIICPIYEWAHIRTLVKAVETDLGQKFIYHLVPNGERVHEAVVVVGEGRLTLECTDMVSVDVVWVVEDDMVIYLPLLEHVVVIEP